LAFAHKYQTGKPSKWRIEVMNLGSGKRRALQGSGASGDINPVWSPDGRQLAFATEINKNRDMWIMDADGSNAHRLTSGPSKQQFASWSPSGAELIFTFNRSESTAGLFRMGVDGSGGIDLGEGGNPSWSINDDIIFELGLPYQHDIWRIKPDGSGRAKVVDTPNLNEEMPVWSPDGTRIAFVSNSVTGRPDTDLNGRQIWVMNADGSDAHALTSFAEPSTNPTWSPDGQSIAFVSQHNSSMWQVWTMRADGADQTRITSDNGMKFYLSWTR
jgi:Tol biopolymer transport system component